MHVSKITRQYTLIALTVFLIGAYLRFYNPHWDWGMRLHPDERLIVSGAYTIEFFRNLDPQFHDYNGLSVYLLKAAVHGAAWISGSNDFLTSPEQMTIVGRALSATLSSISIVLVYWLGILLWGPAVGLIGSVLFSFSPLSIQLAHFYTTDTLITFFLLTAFVAGAIWWTKPRLPVFIGVSAAIGLAIATKNTGYFFAPFPVLLIVVRKMDLRKKCIHLLLFVQTAVLAFFAGSPYSFFDWKNYMGWSRYLSDVVSGRVIYDWTVQFMDTGIWFWIKNSLFAFGPLTVALGFLGVIAIIGAKRKHASILVVYILWCLFFTLVLLLEYVKFIRYLAPLGPLLCLFAGYALTEIQKKNRILGLVVGGLSVGAAVGWGLAFFMIYTSPHPAARAAKWIASNVPGKAYLVGETWNEVIGYSAEPLRSKQLKVSHINFYSPDTNAKMSEVIDEVTKADFIIIETPKVMNTITRLRDRYPLSVRFYQHLFAHKLGFIQAAQFGNFPRIGPLVVNDGQAEETFSVFDHGMVTIFRNEHTKTRKELESLLGAR